MLLQSQDSIVSGAGGPMGPLWREGGSREASMGSTIGELALLQRQHSLLQGELLRLRDAENRYKDSEKARVKLEKQVRHMKGCGSAAADSLQQEEHTSAVSKSYSPHWCRDTGVTTRKTRTGWCFFLLNQRR